LSSTVVAFFFPVGLERVYILSKLWCFCWTTDGSILFIGSESLTETFEVSSTTMSLPPTKFEDASRIEPLGSHEYAIKVHPDFAWGTVAHGGYLFSLLWKAIAEHYRTTLKSYDQPDTVAMHVELLRPVPLGEAVIQIKDVRLGKGSSTVHVALVQGGKERVVGYAT